MASLAQFPSPSPAPRHDYDAQNGGHDARLVLAHALAKKLPRRLRFLYLCVVEGMWPDDERGSSTWRSLGRIAVDVDCSRRTARRGVDELVKLGFLRREYGGAVRRNGRVVKGSLSRTPKLSFMRNPEQERAQRDARHAERLAHAEANRAARAADFAAIHERRVRLQAAVETGAVQLVDGAAQLQALNADERELERACGFTWNRNTVKAQRRKAQPRTTPTHAGKPRADAQFVKPSTVAAAVAQLAHGHDMDAASVPVCAKCSRRHPPKARCWFVATPPALCACGATVVRHPDTGHVFTYDARRGQANLNAPHVCPA